MHLYGKPTNKQIGKAWLEKNTIQKLKRAYLGTFQYSTVVNFHAITKQTKPETEIKYFSSSQGVSYFKLFCR
jgi:hypothetical protein